MKSLLALLGFCVLSALLAAFHHRSVSRQQISPVTAPVMATLAPGQRMVSDMRQTLVKELPVSTSPAELAAENHRLRNELAKSRAAVRNVQRLQAENDRLTRMLGLHSTLPSSIAARIIGEGGAAWAKAATLDRGSQEGVRPKDPVVTDAGLVGQITEMVGPGSSIVLYLTDPSSSVSVRVHRKGVVVGIVGVVRGEGKDTLSLRYLDKTADVKRGDDVETSGWGGIFPPGLYLGKVISVQPDVSGTGRMARVAPAVRFDQLQDALILKHGL